MMTTSEPKLTKVQMRTIAAAQRAHRDPKPEIGWTEQGIIGECLVGTKNALERLDLIESYFTKDGATRYRLTEAGRNFKA